MTASENPQGGYETPVEPAKLIAPKSLPTAQELLALYVDYREYKQRALRQLNELNDQILKDHEERVKREWKTLPRGVGFSAPSMWNAVPESFPDFMQWLSKADSPVTDMVVKHPEATDE